MDVNAALIVRLRLLGLLHVENGSGSFAFPEVSAAFLRSRFTLEQGRIATSILNGIF
jgi:hypothetical protein